MIRGGKGPLEVKVAKDNILLVRVCIFYAKAEVSDRSGARVVCSESHMFRAEDLPSLYVVHGKGNDTRGPEFI